MLELRPNCEHCNKALLPDNEEAMICSFECTFCINCVENVLENICPNCGGGFVNRPIRPKKELEKHPAKKKKTLGPINASRHLAYKKQYLQIPPNLR